MPVTLINPFHLTSVPEAAFVQSWKETASVFAGKPGYLDTRLHVSLDPNARFRYVNVAHWESAEAWREAMQAFPPQEKSNPGVEANPVLYATVEGGAPEPQNSTVEDEVRDLENGLARAYQTHDSAFLANLLAEDYEVVDGPGTVSNKAKVLADHEKKRLTISAFHFDEMRVRTLSADAALVTGRYTWSAAYDGHPIGGTFRYLRGYTRAGDGRWRLKAAQVTPVLQ